MRKNQRLQKKKKEKYISEINTLKINIEENNNKSENLQKNWKNISKN